MLTNKDRQFLREHFPVLRNLSQQDSLLWLEQMTAHSYAQGAKIQCSEDDSIGMILLKSGDLRVFLLSVEGRELTLYRLHFGEICLFSTADALQKLQIEVQIEAETDCELIVMDNDCYDNFCEASPSTALYFSQLLNKRLVQSLAAMERVLSMSLDQRLAYFLANEIADESENKIVLTHDEIARHVGSSREVITRALNSFSEEGLVKLSRGNVEVIAPDKLDQII